MHTVFFDLETGGVEPKHPTIQIAAIAVDAMGDEVAHFEQKIAFRKDDADHEALKLNHYDPAAWTNAVTPARAAGLFAGFVKPYSSVQMISKRTGEPYKVARLAGYNALTFDLPRLKALFGSEFFPCSYLVRDVLQRVLFYFDERPMVAQPENFKLSTIAEYFHLSTDGAHDALADARLSAAIARLLAEEVSLGRW